MQQIQTQQDKPLQQGELRTVVWQNGKSSTESSPETLQEILHDPHALIWLDILGACGPQQVLLHNVFELAPITLQTMDEEKERAKFTEQEHYFYLVVHGLSFDPQTDEADTPKLDIVFGKNFILTVHRESLPWLDSLFEQAQVKNADAHLMSRGMAFLLYALLDALVDSYFPVLDDIDDIIDELEDVTVNATTNDVQVRIV